LAVTALAPEIENLLSGGPLLIDTGLVRGSPDAQALVRSVYGAVIDAARRDVALFVHD
jgi:hypothetical protein